MCVTFKDVCKQCMHIYDTFYRNAHTLKKQIFEHQSVLFIMLYHDYLYICIYALRDKSRTKKKKPALYISIFFTILEDNTTFQYRRTQKSADCVFGCFVQTLNETTLLSTDIEVSNFEPKQKEENPHVDVKHLSLSLSLSYFLVFLGHLAH